MSRLAPSFSRALHSAAARPAWAARPCAAACRFPVLRREALPVRPAAVGARWRPRDDRLTRLQRCFMSSSGGGGEGDGDDGEDEGDDKSKPPPEDGEVVEPEVVEGEEGEWRSRVAAQTDDGGDAEASVDRVIADLEQEAGGGGGLDRSLTVSASTAPFLPEVIALPLPRRPLFPGNMHPIALNDAGLVSKALEVLQRSGHAYVGAFFTTDEEELSAISSVDQVHKMGMLASVERMEQTGDGGMQILLKAHRRIKITGVAEDEPLLKVSVDHFDNEHLEFDRSSDVVKAYTNEIMHTMRDMLKLNPLYKDNLLMMWDNDIPQDVARLCDFLCGLSSAEGEELQAILEQDNEGFLRGAPHDKLMASRLEATLVVLKKELKRFELQRELTKEVEEKMSSNQRKYFLNEQLKQIKRELGIEKDDKEALITKFKERLAERNPPEEVQKVIDDEIAKLSSLESASSEFNVTRSYLEWLSALPWGEMKPETLDPAAAQVVLDEDHYGLEDVKERILEFIAVGALRGQVDGKIICLVGPPGVGKTSIGKSVARALGRDFFRFSVGGLTDVAEIKGHRRTYVGAMPGKLVQALKKTESMNPLVLIDEIDKMGKAHNGDPSSALLELLDPEQNANFLDHYLDVPIDLSKVLFLCTANVLDSIPGPLRDRMEVIRLSGYILDEKMAIAEQYLAPQAREACGLEEEQVQLDSEALESLIKGYCREAGVRNLGQHIEKIFRKVALKVVRGEAETPEVVSEDSLVDLVGQPVHSSDKLYEATPPGVVMGLAWTAMGGSTLYVESTKAPRVTGDDEEGAGGSGRVQSTGQLGDVMVESLSIAHSFARRFLHDLQPDNPVLYRDDLHLHVPEGATPKDGPSAGITMVTALLSLAMDVPVIPDLAMTGELSLTGKVMAIGGVKEKVIAARRSGVSTVLLPHANRKDWEELPETLQEGLTVHFVQHYDEVFAVCFPDVEPAI